MWIRRLVTHGLVFALAVLVGFVGLGAGLQVDPIAAVALWVVAAVIAAGNVVWIVRRRPPAPRRRADE